MNYRGTSVLAGEGEKVGGSHLVLMKSLLHGNLGSCRYNFCLLAARLAWDVVESYLLLAAAPMLELALGGTGRYLLQEGLACSIPAWALWAPLEKQYIGRINSCAGQELSSRCLNAAVLAQRPSKGRVTGAGM